MFVDGSSVIKGTQQHASTAIYFEQNSIVTDSVSVGVVLSLTIVCSNYQKIYHFKYNKFVFGKVLLWL